MGLLTTLFRAATPENPTFNLNSPEAWETFVGDSASESGVSVNSEKALTYSPWWRGIMLIANTVARLPMLLYRRVGDGKVRAREHKAYRLLLRKPNPFQTAFIFKQQLMGHALSKGNGYALIESLGDAMPVALWPLDPDNVTPIRKNGRKAFEVKSEGVTEVFSNAEVLHIPGFGYDGLQGYSVIEKARDSLGLGIALRTYGAKYFKNSARASVALETPQKLLPQAAKEVLTSWERVHGGLDNAHKTALLHSGLQAKIISFNAKDSQFMEERQFEIREVANWLGLPPHKLGDAALKGFASLEEENSTVLDDCYDPWLICWEEESEDKLLTEEEKNGDTHLVEFDRRNLVRGNLAARTNYHRAATGGRPWETPNEARSDFGLNPDESPESNEILTPLNMGKGGQDNQPEDLGGPQPGNPTNNDAKRRETYGMILSDCVGRMARRIATHAERAAKDRRGFETWATSFVAEHSEVVGLALLNIDTLCATERGTVEPNVADWLLQTMHDAYADALDTATPRTLAADVARLNARLTEELPTSAIERFLP